MTAGELALVVAVVLCSIGFTATVVLLVRVRDTLLEVRSEVAALRDETGPLLADLHRSTADTRDVVDAARADLDRFDRVLGSAEAISGAVTGSSRMARAALSTPVIKAAGIATGTSRAMRRLRRGA